MHQAVRRGDDRSSRAVIERSREITTDALARVGAHDRTVAGEIVTVRFIEKFAAGIGAGDWTPVLTWVDTTAQRYAGMLPVAALLNAAVETMSCSLAATPNLRIGSAELDVVRAEVERLTSRPRLVRDPAGHEAIDEIDVALDDLVTRLDDVDALTAEHSRAVSTWCARIAERLALAKHDAIHVARCGLIHDIGKLTTPLDILNAPRSLSGDEMSVMRRHAEDGAAIVVRQPLVAHVAPAVRSHHERFDGHGYPSGLAAAAIPSAARIVAVADAFNAMIGRRPYRPPFAPSVALERLQHNRGSQFDPIVVDAMIDVVTNRT